MARKFNPDSENSWGFAYDCALAKPMDTKWSVPTEADLTDPTTWLIGPNYYHYNSMPTIVAATGDLWVYVGETGSTTQVASLDYWKKIGSSNACNIEKTASGGYKTAEATSSTAANAFAIGLATLASNKNEFALGTYNKSESIKTVTLGSYVYPFNRVLTQADGTKIYFWKTDSDNSYLTTYVNEGTAVAVKTNEYYTEDFVTFVDEEEGAELTLDELACLYDNTLTFNNSKSSILGVGIGTSTERKNAVIITDDGNVYVKGLGNYDGTNYGEEGVISLKEVLESSTCNIEKTDEGGYKTAEASAASGALSFAIGYNTQATGDYSYAEGYGTQSSGNSSHAEGNDTKATGANSHAEGAGTTASEYNSHAEGTYTKASGNSSHAEGLGTVASGALSHAEGNSTNATGSYSHTEGLDTYATIESTHAEGAGTAACGALAHSEGSGTFAAIQLSHAEGLGTSLSVTGKYTKASTTLVFTTKPRGIGMDYPLGAPIFYENRVDTNKLATISEVSTDGLTWTLSKDIVGEDKDSVTLLVSAGVTYGLAAHSEGSYNSAIGQNSHSEGQQTVAFGMNAHSEGYKAYAQGALSHAEGNETQALQTAAHAEGMQTIASAVASHAEGCNTEASGACSHAEGWVTKATSDYAHAEGFSTTASGMNSHSEGASTKAAGINSHAEGESTLATAKSSHAEGMSTIASSDYAHAEGFETVALTTAAHAEGVSSRAIGLYAHAEGYDCDAEGEASHALGCGTLTVNKGETACGIYNWTETTATSSGKVGTFYTIGNGAKNNEKNLVQVDVDGAVYITGIGGFTGANSRATGVLSLQSAFPSTDNIIIKQTSGGWKNNGAYSVAQYSTVLGYVDKNTGKYCFSAGNSNTSSGSYNMLLGDSLVTQNTHEIALGSYNISTAKTDDVVGTLFSYGVGTSSSNKSNLIEIATDGKIYIKGIGNYDGTNLNDEDVEDIVTAHYVNKSLDGGYYLPGNRNTCAEKTFLEGYGNEALSVYSHAEGSVNIIKADGFANHIEGEENIIESTVYDAHVEGSYNTATNDNEHAQGTYNYSKKVGEVVITVGNVVVPYLTQTTVSDQKYACYGPVGDRKTAIAKVIVVKGVVSASGTYPITYAYTETGVQFKATETGSYVTPDTLTYTDTAITADTISIGTLSTIGNGYSPMQKVNAVEVLKNNNVYIYGIGGFDGTNSQDSSIKPIQEAINDSSGITSITYTELCALVDASSLTPGKKYRITDFVTNARDNDGSAGSSSAKHQFDIIVTALTTSTIDENAKAALHAGDTYFQYCNMGAWEIKYKLQPTGEDYDWVNTDSGFLPSPSSDVEPYVGYFDVKESTSSSTTVKLHVFGSDNHCYSTETLDKSTNTHEYMLADMGSGTYAIVMDMTPYVATTYDFITADPGVIYYMKDEFGNEAPYDFKNVQFKRSYLTTEGWWGAYDGHPSYSSSSAVPCYTFNKVMSSTATEAVDITVPTTEGEGSLAVFNKIAKCYVSITDKSALPGICCFGITKNNNFDCDCLNISIYKGLDNQFITSCKRLVAYQPRLNIFANVSGLFLYKEDGESASAYEKNTFDSISSTVLLTGNAINNIFKNINSSRFEVHGGYDDASIANNVCNNCSNVSVIMGTTGDTRVFSANELFDVINLTLTKNLNYSRLEHVAYVTLTHDSSDESKEINNCVFLTSVSGTATTATTITVAEADLDSTLTIQYGTIVTRTV